MAAAGLAPDELAGTHGQPLGRAFLVDQFARDHVGLLDQHMLVVGQHGARLELHQQRRDAGLRIEIERLCLAAGKARLLPFHLGWAHDVRVAFHAGLGLAVGCDGVHGLLLCRLPP